MGRSTRSRNERDGGSCPSSPPSTGDAGAVGSPLLPCCAGAGRASFFSVIVLGIGLLRRPFAEDGRERKESQT
jgi:hypothetical protein